MDQKPISQICEEASEYLDEHGWCQGQLHSKTGQVCMMGAVVGAMDLLDVQSKITADGVIYPEGVQEKTEYFNVVLSEIRRDLPDDLVSIPTYNDLVATDKTEIQNQLLKTAKRLRNRGE